MSDAAEIRIAFANAVYGQLDRALASDRALALEVVTAWLEDRGAGVPGVALLQEQVRSDALFWAEVASPPELEAYVVAGITRLGAVNFASRQIKRLVGMLWRRMTPDEQAAFLAWKDK